MALTALGLARALDERHRAKFAFLAVALYGVLGLFAYWPSWPGDPHLIVGGATSDPVQQSWFLGWFSWALFHGHNPFITNWIDYPSGVNLAANTEMPFLGFITTPISLAFNSVASYQFLMWFSYPISAASAFFVLRYWTRSNLGAFFGGLLYGFSPYLVGQGYGHLNLTFVPLPPLIFLALHEMFVRQSRSWRVWGALSGLSIAVQYLISPEVLASTLLVSAITLIVLALAKRQSITRTRVAFALRGLGMGVPIVLVIIAVPLYYQFAGPDRWSGPVFAIDNPYRADLLGTVLPTSAQLVNWTWTTRISDTFATSVAENGSYLGIPLILVVLICVTKFWKDRWVRLACALALIALLLSLGPTLVVGNHDTHFPMPFRILDSVPVLNNVLPVRLSLYVVFFVAVILSLSIKHGLASSTATEIRGHLAGRSALAVVSAASLVFLIPRWPDPMGTTSSAVPTFVTTAAQRIVPAAAIALCFPFPEFPYDEAMLWQIESMWRWKIVGGYALVPNVHSASADPPLLAPPSVQTFLEYYNWPEWQVDPISTTAPHVNRVLIRNLRAYAANNHITVVLFTPAGRDPSIVLAALGEAFGHPHSFGNVEYWLLGKQ